jgi:hypothetical protein
MAGNTCGAIRSNGEPCQSQGLGDRSQHKGYCITSAKKFAADAELVIEE